MAKIAKKQKAAKKVQKKAPKAKSQKKVKSVAKKNKKDVKTVSAKSAKVVKKVQKKDIKVKAKSPKKGIKISKKNIKPVKAKSIKTTQKLQGKVLKSKVQSLKKEKIVPKKNKKVIKPVKAKSVVKATQKIQKKEVKIKALPKQQKKQVKQTKAIQKVQEKQKELKGKKIKMAAKERTRYSDEELHEFKELIIDKLDKARKDLELLTEAYTNTGGNTTDDTSPTFKVLEEGSQVLSKEENSQLAGRLNKFIQNLEAALVRIENKTYGICRVTGKLIPKERLRSVPHATLSIEAKLGQKS